MSEATIDDAIVRIKNLEVEFKQEVGVTHALRGINLDLKRGATTAIVGESGSGKSVTAMAMLRLIQPPGRVTQGSIEFNSTKQSSYDVLDLANKDPRLRQHRGGCTSMVFQEPMTALSPVHTIGDQVSEALLVHSTISKADAMAETTRLLGRVGIPQPHERLQQYPFEFSGGMRQRVVIAMAMITQPELLICDEPTTALDVTVQAEILALINELKQERNVSVLFITHDIGVVAQVADRVAVMYGGLVLEVGTVHQVLKAPLHPYTQGLLAAIPGQDETRGRLQTIDELVSDDDLNGEHPLVHVGEGRLVALPPERLAATPA